MPTDRPRPARTEAGPTGDAGPGTATRPGPGGDRAATRLPRRVRVMRRLSRELPSARCGVAWIPRLEVPGADGVTLLADHYVPLADEGRGTILVRTPYGRGFPWAHLYGVAFAEQGFHVLLQSCRGTGGSTGVPYLENTARYRIFEELWAVRTLLVHPDERPSESSVGAR